MPKDKEAQKVSFLKNPFKYFLSLSWKKKIAIVVVVIVPLILFSGVFAKDKSSGYEMDVVQRRNITEDVSESGNVVTRGRTDITSPTRGIIDEIYVKNGDIVGVDKPLFKVISTATEDEKAAAEANLLSAQNALKTAEQNKETLEATLESARKAVLDARTAVHQRNDLLIKGEDNPATGDPYTEAEIESIDASLDSAIASYEATEKKYVEADLSISAARASLENARLQYESTEGRTVLSPAIGTVANLSVSPGDSVLAKTATISPQPVLTIANFSTDSITIDVDESDISKLEVGQPAKVEVDALDLVYDAYVSRVDQVGTTDGNGSVVRYTVYLEFDNKDERIKSGMSVDVDIITKEISNALTVPNSAIKPYQGGRAVRKLNDQGEIVFIPVEVGVRGQSYTEILSGLSEGEEIIVSTVSENGGASGPFGF